MRSSYPARTSRPYGRIAIAAAMGALTVATPAHARAPIETILQDDAVLQYRSAAETGATMRRLRALGVDRVRLTASWSLIAPTPDLVRRPTFDAADPDSYPRANWRGLDQAVRLARAAGLEVMIDVAFWAPRWATVGDPGEGRARIHINTGAYVNFTKAVVRRYSGSFIPVVDDHSVPPPSKDRTLLEGLLSGDPLAEEPPPAVPPPPVAVTPLPKVRWWTIWNEPNLSEFFKPQYERTPGGLRPLSPHLYRRMVEATYPAIKAIQPDSKVLVGGTAAIGAKNPASENSGMPPLRFLRELACVNHKFRPIQSGRCSGFRRLPGDGYSHHPYSLGKEPDFVDRRNPDKVPIGALDRLTRTLTRLVRMGRIDGKLADVYLTEFGYETRPDPKAPFSFAQQARFINWAEYLAWKNPRVRTWPQFLLHDVPDPVEYQTGLMFVDGSPKPASRSFEFALHVECVTVPVPASSRARHGRRSSRRRARRARASRHLVVWGHLRSGAGARPITLSVRRGDQWVRATTAANRRGRLKARGSANAFVTGADGVFVRRARERPGAVYRAEYVAPNGSVRRSLEVPVTKSLSQRRGTCRRRGAAARTSARSRASRTSPQRP